MFDFLDIISLPRTLLLGVLRALWWLGWEFCVQTVGWSVGWFACRAVTFGRFPSEQRNQLEDAGLFVAFVVEVLGLALIALGIYLLSQSWPHL